MGKVRKASLYENHYTILSMVDDATAGRLIKAVGAYMFNDTEPTLDGDDRVLFLSMKLQLDENKKNIARSKGGTGL